MKLRYLIAICIAFSGLYTATAFAQSDAIKSAREEVITSIEKLNALDSVTLKPEERAELELSLKRVALGKILTLSTLETSELRDKFIAIEVPEGDFSDLQILIADELKASIAVFAAQEKKTVAAKSITEIQTIATEIKTWRETKYNPEIRKTIDFMLVFQNGAVLKTAEDRLLKIEVNLEKTNATKSKFAESLLEEAREKILEAKDLHDNALQLLLAHLPKKAVTATTIEIEIPVIEEDVSTTTEDGTVVELPEPEIEKPILTIRELVESSIRNIKDAYKNFIALSEFLK
ncbi:MAG: hypothetical protein AAB407_00965 [Patescibacteria group bacterium]